MIAPDWQDEAACSDLDPELFFPEGTTGPAMRQADAARQVCLACPVRVQCLEFAVRNGLSFGIWGGASEAERRVLHRRLLRQAG